MLLLFFFAFTCAALAGLGGFEWESQERPPRQTHYREHHRPGHTARAKPQQQQHKQHTEATTSVTSGIGESLLRARAPVVDPPASLLTLARAVYARVY